jgi:hypothetical protein
MLMRSTCKPTRNPPWYLGKLTDPSALFELTLGKPRSIHTSGVRQIEPDRSTRYPNRFDGEEDERGRGMSRRFFRLSSWRGGPVSALQSSSYSSWTPSPSPLSSSAPALSNMSPLSPASAVCNFLLCYFSFLACGAMFCILPESLI